MTNRPPAVEAAIRDMDNIANGYHGQIRRVDTAKVLTDYIRQLEQAAPVWMPIETAPKDGTGVLLSDGIYIEFGRCENNRWYVINNGDYNDGGYGNDYRCDDDNSEWGYRIPTHWQPLPTPPSSDTAATGGK